MATTYRANLVILQSQDKRAEASKRKREVYEKMALSLNSKNVHVRRSHLQISEKIRHLLSDARKLPHARKTMPTGGGPPLSPLPAWQQILVDIVRDSPATEGVTGGVESEVKQQPEAEEIEVDADEFHIDVMEQCFEEMSSPQVSRYSFEHVEEQAETTKKCKDIPRPRRNTLTTVRKSLQDEQRELIQIEKEKLRLEKRYLRWKIKLSKLRYVAMTKCERLPKTDSENDSDID